MGIEGLNIELCEAGVYILWEDGDIWISGEKMFMNGAKAKDYVH